MRSMSIHRWRRNLALSFATSVMILLTLTGFARAQTESPPAQEAVEIAALPAGCLRTITADVVALDQPFFWNRLGAVQPQGMIYALRRDVVPTSGTTLTPGNVRLRDGKRPRPLTLRMNIGDCIQIKFQNLLNPNREDNQQPATRTASVHVSGLQLVTSILDDGSNVGQIPPIGGLVNPGQSIIYTYYAEREGSHLISSAAAMTGGEGDGGQIPAGLFGAVSVNKRGAEWYRSQLTAAQLNAAKKLSNGTPVTNPNGTPQIDYTKLRILSATNEIVHSDLSAIITGPNAGRFPAPPAGACPNNPPDNTYCPNPVEPDRLQPFREFVLIYHDEIGAVQAFPQFEDDELEHTLHGVRDGFAINYSANGAGAEILANRIGVGPMHDCTECYFEEFFLSSWAIGDPGQIVDVPANAPCTKEQIECGTCNPTPGPKATKVLFPDDPSNVYHSYINDHTKMRIIHAGPKEHHIHHLHAHQWLHTPDSDNSNFLDSQAIGPGSSFTTEIAHGGAGNRGKTVGDAIFHCHFYPHFAQGMWGLWRVHDVFEAGTVLDAGGRPAVGSRALPDGEIAKGTPIPAIVPLPTRPIAPLPEAKAEIVTLAGLPGGQIKITGTGNPGYPFFNPSYAGHKPTAPPFDVIDDGGLPRHVIRGGQFFEVHNRLDFSKNLITAIAEERPEHGTPVEQAAINYHRIRSHPSFTPEGVAGNFITNGLPRFETQGNMPGAPFADPCVDDNGNAIGTNRVYKAVAFQMNLKFNKAQWHYEQSRILSLWGDHAKIVSGEKAPEPLFFRANTNDCIIFHHTNLIPRDYELDDFQIRAPTEIVGQHIHLVKFDVLASDGAENGYNYEDGTFAPGEVIERIDAINLAGGLRRFNCPNCQPLHLEPEPHPFFQVLGAQTTVQRWFADNVLNNLGQDRTLRTVFTHDHFAPAKHQLVGLYAGLVIEPQGSRWRDPETGIFFGTNINRPVADGGPTSWRADILTGPENRDSYREFLLEFGDFTLAYDGDRPVNPPARNEVGLPFLLEPAEQCPGGVPRPCPEAIPADDPGTMTVNYRNEPIALRVRAPGTNTQAAGIPGDLSHVFRSGVTRADTRFNQLGPYPPLTGGVLPTDPFTPLLRAYENDKVQIRILVGAQEEGHNFTVHGIDWLFEPSFPNSGYRNSQMMGISEHYEFVIPPLAKHAQTVRGFTDYLYAPGWSTDDLWNGMWGLMRAYTSNQADLLPLPNNPNGNAPPISNIGDFNGVCIRTAPVRNFDISAVAAQLALPNGTLVYNPRTNQGGKLHDPTAILFVRSTDLDATNKLKPGVPIEPLILRANAGDCIEVTLRNKLPSAPRDLPGFNTLPMIINRFNANQLRPSNQVGLHPQLLFFDPTRSNGVNVGFNPVQTVAPGGTETYQWYAGDMQIVNNAGIITGQGVPIEFGATGLMSSDPIKHGNKGAVGALIIEPRGSDWTEDTTSRASANVFTDATKTTLRFREFVTVFQNDINLRRGEGDGVAVPNLAEAEDPEDSGQKAVNYRTEPMWKRLGFEPDTPLTTECSTQSGQLVTNDIIFTNALNNQQVGGDPVTPVFTARAGTPVRFRVVHPAGHQRNNTFMIHGHIWEEEPYVEASTVIGSNPRSEWIDVLTGVGPSSHFDVIPKNGAGGKFRITGDYLWRTGQSFQFDGGIWGIFRVTQ